MKKMLFVFVLMVFSISAVLAQVAANITDSNGKKQGLWEDKSNGGSSKGTYVDNQKEGCWASYSTDGKLIRIENFSKGVLNGITVEIDQRGYLVGETYYVNNLIEGKSKKFFYGTSPASTVDYMHGKINGRKKLYYENSAGKLLEDSEYKEDVKNGRSNFYTLNGDPIAEYNYVDNMLQGVQKSYYPGNKLMTEQEFKDNIENGFSKEYYENGKLKSEGTYLNGSLNGPWKEYDEDGKLKAQGNFSNGEKAGKWLDYDVAGKVIKTTNYLKGKIK